MWDMESSTRQYGIVDVLIDGVIAISVVQLVDGTIKGIRGPPKDKNDSLNEFMDKNDDDKKGGPPTGGDENKFMGLFKQKSLFE